MAGASEPSDGGGAGGRWVKLEEHATAPARSGAATGATLWVRTDVGPLANDMRAVLNARADFEPMPLAEHPLDAFPRSERDTRSVKLGLPVHRLYYVKRG